MTKQQRKEAMRAHMPWACMTGVVWALSFLIAYDTPIRLCLFLQWTGYPCMFCGFTRSFAALSQGAWSFALQNAPLAIALYLGMVGVFCWNVTGLMLGRRLKSPHATRWLYNPWMWIALTVLVLLNWAYRLGAGLK